MGDPFDLRSLTHQELIARLKNIVERERRHLAELLACLAEVQRRKAYGDEGFPNLFEYCVAGLRYSNGAAFRRVRAARAANLYPEVYSLVADGSLTLTAIAQIEPLLCPENKDQLLSQAQGKSSRELERMVAALDPRAAISDRIRSQAARQPIDLQLTSVPPRERLIAVAPERVQFSFTGSEQFRGEVERVRQLLRPKYPEGKLEDVFQTTVGTYLDGHDPDRLLMTKRPAPRHETEARRIPQWVRDAAWKRDEGRCAFIAPDERRCAARENLEFDHVRPYALGGRSDDPENVRLLCRTHNQLAARRVFGERA